MSYPLTFGSYVFPSPATIYVAKVPMARVVPSAKTPRYDGARTLSGMLDLKKFSLQGTLFKPMGNTTAHYLRIVVDDLHEAMAQQGVILSIDADRYWRGCHAEAYTDSYDATSYFNYVDVAFDVVTGDPYSYDITAQTIGRNLTTTGQTQAATNGGNAPGAPQVVLTAGSTATLAATVTNQTTGDVFTLNGAVTSGDVITVDGLLSSVTRAGIDVTSLFDGQYPRLAVGANTFRVDWTSGSLSHITINWNNRYF